MAPSKIKISSGGICISPDTTRPQLMPFHIGYTGAAPIATFFRVRELKDESPDKSVVSLPPIKVPEAEGGAVNGERLSFVEPKRTKRLVAAFRGRQVVGTEIPLPEGYAGAVLRSSTSNAHVVSMNGADGVLERNGNTNGKKGSTRGSQRSKPIQISDDDADVHDSSLQEMDVDSPYGFQEEVKVLRATQTFQSLLVWNADVAAVDEGQDEYVRALREWTAVAAELHRMED